MAANPDGAFTTEDLQLLPARYTGEQMPDGMQWGRKQLGNLFVLDHIRRWGLERVLEIGPGFNFYFPNHLPAYSEYTSLDAPGFYPPEVLAMMRARLPQGRTVDGLIGQPSHGLAANSFDACISVSVLEHIPARDIPAGCVDMFRITQPGGWCLHSVDVPAGSPLPDLWLRSLLAAGFLVSEPCETSLADVDWVVNPPVTEPLSLTMRFAEGYRKSIWTSQIRTTPARSEVVYLIAARKPL